MAEQSRMHAYLNWTKQRIDEMDATLASLEAKAGQVKAEAKPKADQMLADIKKRRDEFQASVKAQAQAGEAAIQASKAQHGFEEQVRAYFDIVGKQIEQQQATFRDVAAAQAKAWQEAADKLHSEASEVASARRADVDARPKDHCKTTAAQTGALWRVASARMPTKWGKFDVIGFERDVSRGSQRIETALAMVMGDLSEGVPLLRIHSQCFTGEMLGSLRCDCRDQLEMAMQTIAGQGRGLVIYEYQEGRGIGLMAKLQAYELQDVGIDTVEANHALGFEADCRDFSLSAAIVCDLGIKRVRLLSNNPHKARALTKNGVEVAAVLSCEAAPNPHSFTYLRTKKERMGHALSLGMPSASATQVICARCDFVEWRTCETIDSDLAL